MKNERNIIILCLLLIGFTPIFAQDLEDTKAEIKEAALKEQNAFKSGNCDEVLVMMEENITFLANGRQAPSKAIIGKFCKSIPRPFKTATKDNLEFFALTLESGYTIRTLVYPKDEKTNMQEYVTKIWRKTDGKWKISHLHSTVKEIPSQ